MRRWQLIGSLWIDHDRPLAKATRRVSYGTLRMGTSLSRPCLPYCWPSYFAAEQKNKNTADLIWNCSHGHFPPVDKSEGLIGFNDHDSTSAVGIVRTGMLGFWNFGDGKIMSSCLCILCILCRLCYTVDIYWHLLTWSGNSVHCRNDGSKAREQGNDGEPRCWSCIAIDDVWMRRLCFVLFMCYCFLVCWHFVRCVQNQYPDVFLNNWKRCRRKQNSHNSSVGKPQLYCFSHFSRSLQARFGVAVTQTISTILPGL